MDRNLIKWAWFTVINKGGAYCQERTSMIAGVLHLEILKY